MPRYVTQIRFTDQGAREVRKSSRRALAFKKAAKKAGVAVEAQLWTLGAIDGLLILNGEETKVRRCLSGLLQQGNVRTETFPAYDMTTFEAGIG